MGNIANQRLAQVVGLLQAGGHLIERQGDLAEFPALCRLHTGGVIAGGNTLRHGRKLRQRRQNPTGTVGGGKSLHNL